MTYLNVDAEEVHAMISESLYEDGETEDFGGDESYFGEQYENTVVWVDEGPFGYEVSCDEHGVVEQHLHRRADAKDAARRHNYSEHNNG